MPEVGKHFFSIIRPARLGIPLAGRSLVPNMPTDRKLCPTPGCKNTRGDCPRHNADHRPSAAKRGYSTSHKINFREAVLTRDPVCVICGKHASTVADHWPLSRKRLVKLGLDPNNPSYGRGTCWSCHSKATVKLQPGGFNAPR